MLAQVLEQAASWQLVMQRPFIYSLYTYDSKYYRAGKHHTYRLSEKALPHFRESRY